MATRVLISEGCTHHRQCGDIGTVKLPERGFANTPARTLQFAFTSGGGFPEDLSPYALIVHCGGCMLNEREMQYRLRHSAERNVPMTNYGIAIAHMHGILDRGACPLRSLICIRHGAAPQTDKIWGALKTARKKRRVSFSEWGLLTRLFCFRLRCETTPVQCK